MDSDILLIILLGAGVYFYLNKKPGGSPPVPGIGNQSGSALVGPPNKVMQDAKNTNSFFQQPVITKGQVESVMTYKILPFFAKR